MRGIMVSPNEPFLERLAHWAAETPDKVVYRFADDHGRTTQQLTYAELEGRSSELAQHLLEQEGLSRGDRALLVYPPSLDFIAAFIACLKAGVIAVPVFPPHPAKLKKDLYMFCAIQSACGASVALTSTVYSHAKMAAGFRNLFSAGAGPKWPEDVRWITTDAVLRIPSAGDGGGGGGGSSSVRSSGIAGGSAAASDVSFLQFTSGSTSEPKGVMISFGNLAHNLSAITLSLGAVEDTVVVSWLPQYHDMGLIGAYLGTAYCGGSGVYLSPLSFIKRPVLWLQLVAEHRATHLQAPNFAYVLCARKYLALPPAERPRLDLSSVRHMINAAEPVTADAISAFRGAFGPCGLGDVVFPTYGLAESTVFVCTNGRSALRVSRAALEENAVRVADGAAEEARVLVGCGAPADVEGLDVRIVGDGGEELGAGLVGEVWLDSPSKALGYWERPEQSERDFRAPLGGAEYLRTGDLGFLHGGELYICGRRKDLIIVRGRNYYPQDLERAAERASASLRPGCSAAFPVDGAGETDAVAMVAEVREQGSRAELAAVAEEVLRFVANDQGVALSHLALLRPRTVPKTTSGKIARRWCKRAFEDGTLQVLHSVAKEAAGGAGGAGGAAGAAPAAAAEDDGTEPLLARVDVGDKTEAEVLEMIRADAAEIVGADVPVDAPLSSVVDSMGLANLEGTVAYKFEVELPENFCFHEATTLRVLAQVVKEGGVSGPADFQADRAQGGAISVADDCPCLFLCCPGLKPKRKA